MLRVRLKNHFLPKCRSVSLEGIAIAVILTFLTSILGILFYDTVVTGMFSVFLYRPVKRYIDELIRKHRAETLRLQFRDFLSCVASCLSTGRHMEEALKETKAELDKIYSSKDVIIIELVIVITQIESRQADVSQALSNFAERNDVDDIDMFVHIYESCRRSGGDFVSAIYKISDLICQKIEVEKEIKQIISQRKFEGKIITVMPILVLLFLRILSPEYLSIMYTGLPGRIAMTLALMGIYMAYRMIERITDMEI